MPKKSTIRQARYDKAHEKFVRFKFNLRTDEDILNRLDEVPSMQGYIKRLIRLDIAKEVAQNGDARI